MWFDPARDGEGWVLEVLEEDKAVVYWFTYDDEGNQRWLQGVGEIVQDKDGEAIEFPELYVTRGATFGPEFDPEDVALEVVGEAVFTFQDCDHGTFSYSAFNQSQDIEIKRLTQTMAAGCQPINGVPGQPIKEYAGQSGSWFDTSHDGEGFVLHWLSGDEAMVTWYTYDSEGDQYWMIGVGQYQDGKIVFSELQSTRGARFGEAFDPEDVERFSWGSLTIELECSAGSAQYDSHLADFGSGEFDLNRLTHLKRPDCPYARPKLQDLYEITWEEIPIAQGDVMNPNNIQTDSVSDNGRVAARLLKPSPETGANVLIWDPYEEAWSELPGRVASSHLFISPGGESILATEHFNDSESSIDPLMWTEGHGWAPLNDLTFDRNFITSVSQDFSRVTGRGKRFGGQERPWVWSAHTGQQQLVEYTESIRNIPGAPANGGENVVGVALTAPSSGSTVPGRVGLLWHRGKRVEILDDHQGNSLGAAAVCSRDCSLIFGVDQADPVSDDPNIGQAWYWRQSGEFAYLEVPDDALIGSSTFSITDVSADGSVAAGSYLTTFAGASGNSGGITARAFLWTQRTGVVSVRSIIESVGIGDDQWQNMDGISLSSDGRKLLLSGAFITDSGGPRHNRAAVLNLEPRE